MSCCQAFVCIILCRLISSSSSELKHTLSCTGDLSCEGRCSTTIQFAMDTASLGCFCDHLCQCFQDCCGDYQEHCQTNTNSSNPWIIDGKCKDLNPEQLANASHTKNDSITDKENHANTRSNLRSVLPYMNCSFYPHDNARPPVKGIWIVDRCPDTSNLRSLCKDDNPEIKTIENTIPVLGSDNITYKNEFCARCHGMNNFQQFDIELKCYDIPAFYATDISYLLSKCSIDTKIPLGKPFRYCYETVSICGFHWQVNTEEEAELEEECLYGPFALTYDRTTKATYKNYACLLCNFYRWPTCGPGRADGGGWGSNPPFSVMLDFKRSHTRISVTNTIHCADGKFYDLYLEECSWVPTSPPVKGDDDDYLVVMWLKANSTLRWEPEDVTTGDAKDALKELCKDDFDMNLRKANRENGMIRFEFELFISRNLPNQTTTSNETVIRHNCLDILMNSSQKGFISIFNDTLLIFKVLSKLIKCGEPEVFSYPEYRFINDTENIYVKSLDKSFNRKEYYFNGLYPSESPVTICQPFFLKRCQNGFLQYKENETTKLSNYSILVKSTNILIKYGEYNTIKGTIWTCNGFSNSYTKITIRTIEAEFDGILVLLTEIGFSISVMSLTAVLFTYSVFPKLQTMPGKNVMHLCTSTLIYQLLWVLSKFCTESHHLCTTVAIIIHLCVLSSFAWMSIIAFDTCKTFTTKAHITAMRKDDGRRIHVKYVLVAWLAPSLLVLSCIIIDRVGLYSIGYGNDNICFMTETYPKHFFLRLPLACMLLFQIICFSRTISSIWLTNRSTRMIQNESTKQAGNQTVTIAVKLATLMGFMWIFGFLQVFSRVFEYLFVIFGTMNGLYVALAFIINKKVAQLYKEKFEKKTNVDIGSTRSMDDTRVTSSLKALGRSIEEFDTKL